MTRCGVFSISGRPNVGKSTLFNRLLKTHISSVTSKSRTTRSNIRGICNADGEQLVLVDTPGMHARSRYTLDQLDINNAQWALESADLVVLMVEHKRWLPGDQNVLDRIIAAKKPCVLVLNKVDLLRDKRELLEAIAEVAARHDFAEIFPLSALHDSSLADFQVLLMKHLPEGDFLYQKDELTDRKHEALAADMVREQFMRELKEELPHVIHVSTNRFEVKNEVLHIHVQVLVERASQRLILLGKGGDRLKRVSIRARQSIEAIVNQHVHLRLWIKVRRGWQKENTERFDLAL